MQKPMIQETKIVQTDERQFQVELVLADSPHEEHATIYIRGRLHVQVQGREPVMFAQIQREALLEMRRLTGVESDQLLSRVGR